MWVIFGDLYKCHYLIVKFILNKTGDCVMSTISDIKFTITNTKLYISIVTLSSEDNAKLVKLVESGFNRPVYRNEYQTKIETRNLNNNNLTRFPLDATFQGVRRSYVLVFNNTTANGGNNPINNTNNWVSRDNTGNIFSQQ